LGNKYSANNLSPDVVAAFRGTLIDLIVDDARRDWIMRTYPPEDQGRPGILVVRKTDDVRKTDRKYDVDAENTELLVAAD
jgi:hypothetical protein